MKIRIHHTTRYVYSQRVRLGDHHLFLRPLESHLLSVDAFSVTSSPQSTQRWVRDSFNNIVLVTSFDASETENLEITAVIDLHNEERNPFDFVLEPYAVGFPFSYQGRERVALAPAISTEVPGSDRVIDWFYDNVPNPSMHASILGFLGELVDAIHQRIQYQSRDEEGVQSPATTLQLGSGSCRDMAMLFIAICRRLGLAARFVSGYLFDGGNPDGHHNRAAGSMHAWAEVYLPGAGWKGFDPTNGILADANFIPTAVAIDPDSVSPIQGRFFGTPNTRSTMTVELRFEAP